MITYDRWDIYTEVTKLPFFYSAKGAHQIIIKNHFMRGRVFIEGLAILLQITLMAFFLLL